MLKILLEAPILTQSGYGEHSRLVYQSLKSLSNVGIYIAPLAWGKTSWDMSLAADDIQEKIISFRQYIAQCQDQKTNPHFDIQIFIGIPNEFEKKAARSVCVTAGIETDRVSYEWILKTHQGIDKLVVPSEHAKKVFAQTFYEVTNNENNTKTELGCNCPIEVVPYPIKKVKEASIGLELETDFNFLNIALLGPRKNLENSIWWFIEEFKNDKDVGLVLKTGHSAGSIIDRNMTKQYLENILSKYKDRKCKIYLLHGSMSEEEIHALYTHPKIKAYMTATHGEGFGLPLFEAAYSGMPIVATDWSGHLDFLSAEIKQKKTGKLKEKKLFAKVDYSLKEIDESVVWDGVLVKGSKWAYPNETSFRKQLKVMRHNYGMYKKWANILKEKLPESHNREIVLEKMRKSLLGEDIVESLAPPKIEDLPKISIITSVYNGEKYMEGFLKDITRQTVFKEKCELILVNATSPERETEEPIINKYLEQYPDNIKYFVLDEDPGIYGTWNYALSKATGKFITNANLDDRKSEHFIETLSKFLYMNKDVGVVYSENLLTFESNETFEQNSSKGQIYPAEEFSIEAILRGNSPHCMPMWRKDLHEKYGLFDNSYRSAGDWDFWLRCAFSGIKFKKHQAALGLYYFNPKGVSTNVNHDSWKKKEEREIFKKYQKLYIENKKVSA